MSDITIRHTHEDGTLIEGSRKGDGVYEIVRPYGFAYFPSIRAIGIRGSRDQIANRYRINGAAEALRAAGHEVTVEIDDTPRDRATVLADKANRLDDRKDRLEAATERHAAASDAAFRRAAEIADARNGQPILVGHYSEKRARADQRRVEDGHAKACREYRAAQETGQRAAVVGRQLDRSARPDVTVRRIERAEAELRKIDRELDGWTRNHLRHDGSIYFTEEHQPATGGHRESLIARKAQLEDQIGYDRGQIAAAQEAGFVAHSRDTIHVGDLVHNGHSWKTVVKLNPKTVACESGYSWTDKVPYTDIRQVRCTHAERDGVA